MTQFAQFAGLLSLFCLVDTFFFTIYTICTLLLHAYVTVPKRDLISYSVMSYLYCKHQKLNILV